MTIHIGYPTFEDFTRAVDWIAPVYASLITEPGTDGPYGLRTDTHYVFISQPIPADDIVNFYRFKAGSLTLLNGSPFDDTRAKDGIEAALSAYQRTCDWLDLNDFTIKNAVIAWPKDLRLIEGATPSMLAYDPDTNRFTLAADPA